MNDEMITDEMIAAARNKFIAVSHEIYFPSNDQIRCVLEAALSVIHGEGKTIKEMQASHEGREALAWMQMHMPYRHCKAVRAMIQVGEIK